ncbi:MAG: NAD(P)-dependent oxidoreductase [bacterium]
MKSVFFETSDKDRAMLGGLIKNIPNLEFVFTDKKLSIENISEAKDADIISIFINSEIKKDVIEQLPSLKFIATRSTGYDHVDISYATEKGIRVANVPSYGTHTVAEFTFALILSLSRKIYPAYNQLREGSDFNISNLEGFDLYGKTLGIIGMGKIGKNVIRMAKGFGMNILAYDIAPDEKFASETCTKCTSLEEVLAGSDIISIHTLFNKSTYHLINKNNIGKIKKGAYLINTARGEIVETEALLNAIKGGDLAGAGLDVLEAERQLKEESQLINNRDEKIKDFKVLYEDHILIDLPQVIVTPHIAFFTKEAEEEILKITICNIRAFVEGRNENLIQV